MISDVRRLLMAAVLVSAFATQADAQGAAQWTYQVGARTTVMTSEMRLSDLGPPFEDLEPGGKALAHASGLFVMWRRGERFGMGIETLVGNSYGNSERSILFQGAGVLAEYHTTGRWFLALGIDAGGMIASATESTGGSSREGVAVGTSYKGSGLFAAPTISIGRVVRSLEVRLLARRVWHVPGVEGLDAFDSSYLGASLGFRRWPRARQHADEPDGRLRCPQVIGTALGGSGMASRVESDI